MLIQLVKGLTANGHRLINNNKYEIEVTSNSLLLFRHCHYKLF